MEEAKTAIVALIKKPDSQAWDQLLSIIRRKADKFAVSEEELKSVASYCEKYLKTVSNARFYSLYNQLADDDVFFEDYEDDEMFEGKFNFVWDVLHDQVIDLILEEEVEPKERKR